MNEAKTRPRPKKPGLRYETCRVCRNEWNVSKYTVVKADGYLCPKCREKQKRENTGKF